MKIYQYLNYLLNLKVNFFFAKENMKREDRVIYLSFGLLKIYFFFN